ncbi:hypothetical protein GCM10007940_06570 [Portibacter lacus]|uniref:DUF2271 domain-containing protein n=2 Tax=Portibacter lacus TaxID=1099794 RepID=A0AA37SMG7_9BACT|nr:hypothetical protein GCM10007940_06570 [Portibacter lacus]
MINPAGDSQKYKCMIQLTNYTGEGAYIVVSVLDKDKNYLKTLHVLGDDKEWYPDIPAWWQFHSSDRQTPIDGITGATIAGGERSIFPLEIDNSLVDSGNFLRFETSVEHQDYHEEDLQLPLTTETLSGKFEGKGYIRYVRLIANK